MAGSCALWLLFLAFYFSLRSSYELGVNSYIQKLVDLEEFEGAVRQLDSYRLGINHAPPTAAFGMSMPGSTP